MPEGVAGAGGKPLRAGIPVPRQNPAQQRVVFALDPSGQPCDAPLAHWCSKTRIVLLRGFNVHYNVSVPVPLLHLRRDGLESLLV